jgi:hypothetical protein
MASVYIVEVRQGGQLVKIERLGTLNAARVIAQEWRAKGYSATLTDDLGTSYSF